jgi:outer membrane receptor protein involved in Fe transport
MSVRFGIQNTLLSFVACCLISFVAAESASAQATYGTIAGTVTDPSGAVIPGVDVTVINERSGETFTRRTDSAGLYNVGTLIPGTYEIKAQPQGFRTVDVKGLVLQVNQTARFDLHLEVGQTSEAVTVNASAPVLSQDTSDIGQVVTTHQIEQLPLNGRDFLQLASLTNGVILVYNSTQSGAWQFISDGNRQQQNSYLIDGVETRLQREGEPGDDLSIDAIQEFKVLQNSFSAEYGRATAIVNVVVKSGTNQIHGTAFEFLRNNFFDARNAFDLTNVVPPLRRNQFGGSFGGPIKKNKLFYFLNYEGLRQSQSTTEYASVPTSAQLAGNLGTIQVPASQISQYAKALTPYWPAPNSALVSGYNFVGVVPNPINMDQGTARVDYTLSDRDRISGHYQNYDRTALNQNLLPYSGTQTYVKGYNLSAQFIHTFTPTLLNIFTFGYMHTNSLSGPYPTANASTTSTFGLQSLSPDPDSYGPPFTGISGFTGIGIAPFYPEGSFDESRQIEDQVGWVTGKHSLKFGTDIRLYRWNDVGYATQNGEYYFNGQYTDDAFADFLKGLPNFVYVDQLGPGYSYAYDTTNGEYSFYAQDDIRLFPNFTVNAGLRYEYVQWPKEDRNQFAEWDFQTGSLAFACKQIPCRVAPPYKNGWSPRLGFAWTPYKKTVVRAGTSIMYGNFRQWEVSLFHFTPPFIYEYFLNNTIPNPSFTTSTLWPAVPTNPEDINFNLTTVDYQNPNKVLPKYYEWNFNVQQELVPNLLLQVGYVGNRGVHLPVRYDANAPIAGTRPYPNVGFVSGNASSGWSSYNALNVKVEKRYSAGLSLLAAYTWSKNLGIRNYDNYTVFDFTNLPSSYGPVQNTPQVATISFNYELPFGRGKALLGNMNRAVDAIVGGWQLNGIVTFESGSSLDAYSSVFNGQGNRAGNMPICIGSPRLLSGEQSIAQWFNVGAFEEPASGTYGNCGIGILTGPGLQNWDLSLFKMFHLGERATLQLRMENFNAFNHVNYYNPDTNLSDGPQFGVINGANPGREIQLGAKIIF